MPKYYALQLLTLFVITAKQKCMGQIVNMESQRYQTDTTGRAGTSGSNFEKLRIYAGTLPMYEIEKENDRPKPYIRLAFK